MITVAHFTSQQEKKKGTFLWMAGMEGISGWGWEENRPDLWISLVWDGESVREWW